MISSVLRKGYFLRSVSKVFEGSGIDHGPSEILPDQRRTGVMDKDILKVSDGIGALRAVQAPLRSPL